MAILAKDGTTAWFTDPRAVIAGGALFYSTVSGTTSGGNIELHRLLNGVRDTFLLAGEMEVDDHDNASILVLSGGKLAVFYSLHGGTVTHFRVSLAAAPNIGGFGPPQTIAASVSTVSYAHAFLLSDSNVYLFRRNNKDDADGRPHELCVDSESALVAGTATFATKTNIFKTANQRPYAKYVQNGTSRIDCFTSNAHPGEIVGASIYHMYMQLVGGVLKYFQSDGTEITTAKPFDVATNMTAIQTTGSNTNESWTSDVRIGADGLPRCLSARYPEGTVAPFSDIEYWHHRWTGSAWVNTRISQNNITLYTDQPFYFPGLCFDGNDTSIIYMCENDQTTNIAEVKKYTFNESGPSISLTSTITSGSAHNNIRPYSPAGHGANDGLLWATGIYTSYTDYEMDVYVLGSVSNRLPTPASYEAETEALIARMSVAPSTIRKKVINRRIAHLKSGPLSGSNIWAKKAIDYVFQAHDTQAMLLNWKGAVNDLAVTGSPTQTVDAGLKGDAGGTAYLSGPAPNAVGSPFAQNDAHIMGYYGTTATTGAVMRRTTSSPPVLINIGPQGKSALIRLNTTSGFTTANVVGGGTVWHMASRIGASAVNFYRDGGNIGSNTDASGTLDTVALVFGLQASGGFIRMASMGSQLTDNEAADLFFADWEYSRDLSAVDQADESTATQTQILPQIINQPAGAPTIRRRRAQYDNYDTLVRREKIQEIEALKAAILARGEAAPLAAKVREFIPYKPTMNIRTLVAELARVQQELEDEEDMIVLALLH